MSKEKYDNDVLVKALMGYVLIIAFLLVFFPVRAHDLAVRLANGIVPLFFLALGGLVFHYLALLGSRLKTVLDRGKTP